MTQPSAAGLRRDDLRFRLSCAVASVTGGLKVTAGTLSPGAALPRAARRGAGAGGATGTSSPVTAGLGRLCDSSYACVILVGMRPALLTDIPCASAH